MINTLGRFNMIRGGILVMAFAAVLVSGSELLGEERIDIGRFSASDIQGWKIKEFNNITEYSLTSEDGKMVLKAESDKSAAAFYKEIKIDLRKTPFLNWTWKVNNTLLNVDELTKEGDDYPARVYLVFDSGIMIWRIKALNYVWSSNQQVGKSWPSPYSKNVIMKAIQSGDQHVNTWITEKRNVRRDLTDLFGSDIQSIDGVAIMVDTDSSQGKASAYFGDIYFTEK